MSMPKSRDIQAKMLSPKMILNVFWLVTVKVLNSYKNIIKQGLSAILTDLVLYVNIIQVLF